MIKLVETSVTFAEFPDEIALCLNLSNCPNKCPGCSQAYLAQDIGRELTPELLQKLIEENSGITLVGFMGGDNDIETILMLTQYIHEKYQLKVGMYSGRDLLDLRLAKILDYYKIGGWRQPEGDPVTWCKKSCGPLNFPFSNQVMFKRDGDRLVNITDAFRKNPVNNLQQYIV